MSAGLIRVQEQDGLQAIETDHLRLVFTHEADRWRHLLVLGRGGVRRSFADSFEPDLDGSIWHPRNAAGAAPTVVAPVLQELVLSRGHNVVTAMAVGKSGPHFFSATFRVLATPGERGGRTDVQVELADRCPTRTDAPASCYLVYDRGCPLQATDIGSACWTARRDELVVSLHVAPEGDTVLSCEPGGLGPDAGGWGDAHRLCIRPRMVCGQASKRWSYTWSFLPPL